MARGLSRCLDAAHGIRRGEDRDVLIRLEIEQIEIARDDEIGARRERAGEHGIIIRIAASRCRQRLWLDEVSEPPIVLDMLGGGRRAYIGHPTNYCLICLDNRVPVHERARSLSSWATHARTWSRCKTRRTTTASPGAFAAPGCGE